MWLQALRGAESGAETGRDASSVNASLECNYERRLALRQLGGLRVLRGVRGKRRGGVEDPWLCGPGFGRVCPLSWVRLSADSVRPGTGPVK